MAFNGRRVRVVDGSVPFHVAADERPTDATVELLRRARASECPPVGALLETYKLIIMRMLYATATSTRMPIMPMSMDGIDKLKSSVLSKIRKFVKALTTAESPKGNFHAADLFWWLVATHEIWSTSVKNGTIQRRDAQKKKCSWARGVQIDTVNFAMRGSVDASDQALNEARVTRVTKAQVYRSIAGEDVEPDATNPVRVTAAKLQRVFSLGNLGHGIRSRARLLDALRALWAEGFITFDRGVIASCVDLDITVEQTRCSICDGDPSDSPATPCCGQSVCSSCVESFAEAAGSAFRCPFCGDRDAFARHAATFGVVARDAAPDYAADDLENALLVCCSETCACPRGVAFDGSAARATRTRDLSRWRLLVCAVCGQSAAHEACNVGRRAEGAAWHCPDCAGT